jgi:hypothetical protein
VSANQSNRPSHERSQSNNLQSTKPQSTKPKSTTHLIINMMADEPTPRMSSGVKPWYSAPTPPFRTKSTRSGKMLSSSFAPSTLSLLRAWRIVRALIEQCASSQQTFVNGKWKCNNRIRRTQQKATERDKTTESPTEEKMQQKSRAGNKPDEQEQDSTTQRTHDTS